MIQEQLKKTYRDKVPQFNKVSKAMIAILWAAAILKTSLLLLSVFTNGGSNGIIDAITKAAANSKSTFTHAQIMMMFQRNLVIAIVSDIALICLAIWGTRNLSKSVSKNDYLHLNRTSIILIILFCASSFVNSFFFGISYSINVNNEVWYLKALMILSWGSYIALMYLGLQELRFSKFAIQIEMMSKNPLFNNINFQQMQQNSRNSNFNNNANPNNNNNNPNVQNNPNMSENAQERVVQVNTWKEINNGDDLDKIQNNNAAIRNKLHTNDSQTTKPIEAKTTKTDFSQFSSNDLKAIAKNIGIKQYKSMTKAELINILTQIQN